MATRIENQEPWHRKAALVLGKRVMPYADGSKVVPQGHVKFSVIFGRYHITNVVIAKKLGTGHEVVAEIKKDGTVKFSDNVNYKGAHVRDLEKIIKLAKKAHAALKRHAPD